MFYWRIFAMNRKLLLCISVGLVLVLTVSCGPSVFRDTTLSEQSFAVSKSPEVVLNTMPGNLRVVSGEPGRVDVRAEAIGIGGTLQEARKSRESLSLNISRDGNSIRIVGDRKISSDSTGDAWINYELTIPPESKLDVRFVSRESAFQGSQAIAPLILMLLVTILALLGIVILWIRLYAARAMIAKLEFELRSALGEMRMKERELAWRDQ